MKSEKEINDFLMKFDSSINKCFGMTYEQGIEIALQWVLGEISDDEMV